MHHLALYITYNTHFEQSHTVITGTFDAQWHWHIYHWYTHGDAYICIFRPFWASYYAIFSIFTV